MSIKDRLIKFIKYKGISVREFERNVDLSNGYINKIKGNIGEDKLNNILQEYPELNKVWLLTEEGEMINETKEVSKPAENEDLQGYWVPLLPIAAIGGKISGTDTDGIDLNRCDRILSPIPGADMAIPIYGDSMEPEYPSGSQVLVKRIHHDDFIAWGNVYVIDTVDGPLLKMVRRSEHDDCIECVSLNPSGRYQPFDVPKRSIRGMYRVLCSISIKGQ